MSVYATSVQTSSKLAQIIINARVGIPHRKEREFGISEKG
jgi:hypothetical protein